LLLDIISMMLSVEGLSFRFEISIFILTAFFPIMYFDLSTAFHQFFQALDTSGSHSVVFIFLLLSHFK
jgi:hypothetical protein